jgi:hypothetical protein
VSSVVAGSVVSVSVVGGVVVVLGAVVVSPPHPATNIAIQTSINANKLLIAKSPENEMVGKTLASSRDARIQYGVTFAQRLVARQDGITRTTTVIRPARGDLGCTWARSRPSATIVTAETAQNYWNKERKNSARGKLTH